MDRRLQPVPPEIRNADPLLYSPRVLFLAPRPEAVQAEDDPVRQLLYYLEIEGCMVNGVNGRDEYLQRIRERIADVNHFYGGIPGISVEDLALKMLSSACFLVRVLEDESHVSDLICYYLGINGLQIVNRDYLMVENQIPLWLIALLRPANYHTILQTFFRTYTSSPELELPWNMEVDNLPLHYLEAIHRVLLWSQNPTNPQETDIWDLANNPNRSATELVYKGVTFSPSTASLLDVSFTSSKLKLPKVLISNVSKVLISNLMVLEMYPDANAQNGMISYINFMKALLVSTTDVKLLREYNILFSSLSSDEDILDIFKTINTFGISNKDHFLAEKIKIDRYCRRRARKWMASLKDRHFRNPWKIIGLLVATIVVGMYATQTYCLFKDCHHL